LLSGFERATVGAERCLAETSRSRLAPG